MPPLTEQIKDSVLVKSALGNEECGLRDWKSKRNVLPFSTHWRQSAFPLSRNFEIVLKFKSCYPGKVCFGHCKDVFLGYLSFAYRCRKLSVRKPEHIWGAAWVLPLLVYKTGLQLGRSTFCRTPQVTSTTKLAAWVHTDAPRHLRHSTHLHSIASLHYMWYIFLNFYALIKHIHARTSPCRAWICTRRDEFR